MDKHGRNKYTLRLEQPSPPFTPYLDWFEWYFDARQKRLITRDVPYPYAYYPAPSGSMCNAKFTSDPKFLSPARIPPLAPLLLGLSTFEEINTWFSTSAFIGTAAGSSSSFADLNRDGKVDSPDVAMFLRALGSCAGIDSYDPAADYDGDGCVTLKDYKMWFALATPQSTAPTEETPVRIRFNPPTATLSAGQTITVQVLADSTSPVLGWGLSPFFDPKTVAIDSFVVGPSWSSASGGSTLTGLAYPAPVSGASILLGTARIRALQGGPVTLKVNTNAFSPDEGFLLASGEFADIEGAFNPTATEIVPIVSAASYSAGSLASDVIAVAFGTSLAGDTQAATATPLPTSLAGTQVLVKDSAGMERPAPLIYVSPSQVNYAIPPGMAVGAATVTVTSAGTPAATGKIQIDRVAPSLFSANANGTGVAAAIALRVNSAGVQTQVPLLQCSATAGCVAAPIDLGASGDTIVLELFGTGIRGRTALENVFCVVGSTSVQVLYAGAQGTYVGLDQVNVILPRALAGSGEVPVSLVVDGKHANIVKIAVK